MIDTILFDIGGTLITQTRNPQRAILDAQYIIVRLAEIGIDIDTDAKTLADELCTRSEEYKHLGERTLKELSPTEIWNGHLLKDRLAGKAIPDYMAEEFSFCHDFLRLENKPREGLTQALEELQKMGLKIGIITNTMSTTFANHFLKQLGVLQFFPVIVKSCEEGIRKPDSRIFDIAMERIGSIRESTCYVGDTISRDVMGSRNANLALCIRILNPSVAHRDAAFRNADSPRADFDIDKLTQIPDIIRGYNGRQKERP